MSIVYSNPFTGNSGVPTDLVLSQAGPGSGATMDLSGDKFRNITTATGFSALRSILPTSNWNNADGVAVASFVTTATASNLLPQIMLRTSGAWDATQIDSPTTGYKLVYYLGNLEIYKRTGGATTLISPSIAKTVNTTTTYSMKFQVVGSSPVALKAKMWTGADNGVWDIEITDSSGTQITGAGQFMMAFVNTVAAIRQINWDDITLDDLVTVTTGPRPRLMRV